jgi:hypothetical protein
MHKASYYRAQADRSRRLANHAAEQISRALMQLARDLDEIAEDLERGAIEIRHPELMPQRHSHEHIPRQLKAKRAGSENRFGSVRDRRTRRQ